MTTSQILFDRLPARAVRTLPGVGHHPADKSAARTTELLAVKPTEESSR
jgi:hypothetical protein